MIDFQPVTLADKALIDSYVRPSECRNCDMAFANMLCWQFVYQSAKAVVDGFLVIRFRIGGGGKIGYMQPLGEGDFSRIIPSLAEDAHRHGQRLRLIGLSDQGRDILRNSSCGEFAFESDRNMEDYIYNAEELRTLPGRRYQSKRNHINRFTTEYDFRYEPLTRDRFAECLRLEAEWRKAHAGQLRGLSAEQHAMRLAFAHFDELGLVGGCIYANDKMVAFTYGSPINHDTFDCHVEKADTEYDGAFTIINKLFAEHLPPEYLYINREEDLGIEGLRRAKLSYHPALLLRKYTAIHLHRDETEVKRLWKEAFGDGDDFIDSFLIRYYSRHRMLGIERDGRLVSMLHLLPFQSELGRTVYVYGVATEEAFRRQGYATELLREAVRTCRERGDDALMLIPDSDHLRGYYANAGFGGDMPVEFASADGFDFGTGDALRDRAMVLPLRDGTPPLPETLHALFREEK